MFKRDTFSNPPPPRPAVRGLLTAAAVSAAALLGGCDNNLDAQKTYATAQEAARMQQAAGEPRPTEKLYSLVVEKGDAYSELKTQWDGAKGDAQTKLYSEWISAQSPTKDLEAAEKKMKEAMAGTISPAAKWTFEMTAAGIQLQLGADRFAAIQPKLSNLMLESVIVQSLANSVVADGQAAKSAGAGADEPRQARTELSNAQTNLGQRKSASQAAKDKVAGIEKQIADKQTQARDVYAKTDAAFAAADNIKGKAAIAEGNKAMQDRAAGDKLTQEAALLEPDLIAAKSELALALIQEKDAEARVKSTQGLLDAATSYAQDHTRRQGELSARAKKLITDDKGLLAHYKALSDLAAQIDGELAKAADASKQAQESYKKAQASLSSAQSGITPKIADLPRDDPLRQSADDKRINALLSWHEAAASEQLGRVNTSGYLAASIVAIPTKATQDASAAAGAADDGSVKMPTTLVKYQNDAKAAFGEAVRAVGLTRAGGSDSFTWGNSVENIKWIGYLIRAAANQGLSVVDEPAATAAHLKDATTDASAATKSNPSLGAVAGQIVPR